MALPCFLHHDCVRYRDVLGRFKKVYSLVSETHQVGKNRRERTPDPLAAVIRL